MKYAVSSGIYPKPTCFVYPGCLFAILLKRMNGGQPAYDTLWTHKDEYHPIFRLGRIIPYAGCKRSGEAEGCKFLQSSLSESTGLPFLHYRF